MEKRKYYGLRICPISVEPVEGILSASRVIDQNDVVKIKKQEVVDVDLSASEFDVTWE